MEEIEDADPGSAVRSGWLNRFLGADSYTSRCRACTSAVGVPPASMYGAHDVMSARNVDSVGIAGDDQWVVDDGRKRSLDLLWRGNAGRWAAPCAAASPRWPTSPRSTRSRRGPATAPATPRATWARP